MFVCLIDVSIGCLFGSSFLSAFCFLFPGVRDGEVRELYSGGVNHPRHAYRQRQGRSTNTHLAMIISTCTITHFAIFFALHPAHVFTPSIHRLPIYGEHSINSVGNIKGRVESGRNMIFYQDIVSGRVGSF